MADPPTSRVTYLEGMKWTLALSFAAVGGAFLHLSDLSKLPYALRVVGAGAVLAFLGAAFFGVQYFIRLITDDELRQKLKELEDKATQTDEDREKINKLTKRLRDSDKSRPKIYCTQTVFTCVAAGLAVLFLPTAILMFHDEPPKTQCGCNCPATAAPAQPAVDRYAIVYSAVHPGRGGRVQHTFLLDKQTGTVWQMVCRKNGTVEFEESPRGSVP
jgi:hypothetical protein